MLFLAEMRKCIDVFIFLIVKFQTIRFTSVGLYKHVNYWELALYHRISISFPTQNLNKVFAHNICSLRVYHMETWLWVGEKRIRFVRVVSWEWSRETDGTKRKKTLLWMAFDFQLRVRYVLKIKILIAICHLHLLFWYSKGKNPLINSWLHQPPHKGKDIWSVLFWAMMTSISSLFLLQVDAFIEYF